MKTLRARAGARLAATRAFPIRSNATRLQRVNDHRHAAPRHIAMGRAPLRTISRDAHECGLLLECSGARRRSRFLRATSRETVLPVRPTHHHNDESINVDESMSDRCVSHRGGLQRNVPLRRFSRRRFVPCGARRAALGRCALHRGSLQRDERLRCGRILVARFWSAPVRAIVRGSRALHPGVRDQVLR